MILTFFQALWPTPVPGYVTFWSAPSEKSYHVELNDFLVNPETHISVLREENSAKENVYFGLGLRGPKLHYTKQGKKGDVCALPGFVIDIDTFHEGNAHKAKNLPRTEQDVADLISDMPPPTLVVRTGYGFHPYWLFHESLILPGYIAGRPPTTSVAAFEAAHARFQAQVIQKATERGWHMDEGTHTVQRVWRVPGLTNWMAEGETREAETILIEPGIRYSPEELGLPRTAATSVASVGALAATDAALPDLGDVGEDEVEPLVYQLSNLNNTKHRELWKKILAGESFAPPGERERAMRDACVSVMGLPQARVLKVERIAELFDRSLRVWAAEPDAKTTFEEEQKKVLARLRSGREFVERQEEKARAANEGLRSLIRKKEPFREGEPSEPEEERPPWNIRYFIIQFKTIYYVADPRSENYGTAKIKEELLTYLRDVFENHKEVSLTYQTKRGDEKQKTVQMIMDAYGTVASEFQYDLAQPKSTYDPEKKTFYKSVACLRDLAPAYDERVEKWLSLLAGGGEPLEQMLDWLATVTFLDRQTCGLYLSGVKGSGKTILSMAVARLWTEESASELGNVLSQFNSDLLRCPLVVADEYMPVIDNLQARMNKLVGSMKHTISVKHVDKNATLNGSVRLMLLANNEDMLATGNGNTSLHQLEATGSRFLQIDTKIEAKEYLDILGGPPLINKWLKETDTIGKHLLWLRDTRAVDMSSRWLVEGSQDEKQKSRIFQGKDINLVNEWLARFLSDPDLLLDEYRLYTNKPLRARIGDGNLYVTSGAIRDLWSVYLKGQSPSGSKTIGSILKTLANGLFKEFSNIEFWTIPGQHVLNWASESKMGGNTKEMAEYLAKSLADFGVKGKKSEDKKRSDDDTVKSSPVPN